jgi:hypothetical protein
MENHHFQWVNPRTKWFNGISPSGFPMDPHGRSLPVHVAQLLGGDVHQNTTGLPLLVRKKQSMKTLIQN